MAKRARKPTVDDLDEEPMPKVYSSPEEVIERERSDRAADVIDRWYYKDRDEMALLMRYRLQGDDCDDILQVAMVDGGYWVGGWPDKGKVPLYRAYEGARKMPVMTLADVAGVPMVEEAADTLAVPVRWLWPGRVPIGRPTVLFGGLDHGKSITALDLAAWVSTGAEWPDGRGRAPKGKVILMSREDDLADTIRPRLDEAGADPGEPERGRDPFSQTLRLAAWWPEAGRAGEAFAPTARHAPFRRPKWLLQKEFHAAPSVAGPQVPPLSRVGSLAPPSRAVQAQAIRTVPNAPSPSRARAARGSTNATARHAVRGWPAMGCAPHSG
jgi:hypothetical protein